MGSIHCKLPAQRLDRIELIDRQIVELETIWQRPCG